ncbi:hypothetical protein FI667_g17589, partial [Globisporangium splendens]
MSKRTGKENVRATRSSSSHNSSNTNSGSTSKKAVTRQQSELHDEREPLVQLHEDEEQNARTGATKAKRRRVGNALAEEEGRKTQTRSRRQAVRADDEDDVDMETEEGNSYNGSTTSGNGKHNATRREKRKGPSQHTSSSKISPTSAQNLFQFTCRLLQSQKLEFEVRAREFEEKNARVAAERHKWEKKIRGVKRQLQAYGHPVDGVDGGDTASSGNGTVVENGAMLATNVLDPRFRGNTNWNVTATTTSLTTTGTMNGSNGADAGSSNSTHLITMRDAFSSRTSAPASSSTGSGMDSLIPVSIHHMETQIQDTLRLRRQQMDELMKDLHGIHGLNDKITRLR